MKSKLGLIHIYCGDGKGKTTAATGLAIRAAGRGCKVAAVQFLKNGCSAEMEILKGISNITVFEGCIVEKFTHTMSKEEKEECCRKQDEILKTVMSVAEEYDVIILDEIFGAIQSGTLSEDVAFNLIKSKPDKVELIMTGRNPSCDFLDISDYVTEMKKVKHPYDNGIDARCGIEY